MTDRLSFKQMAIKAGFKSKVNSGLGKASQVFPGAKELGQKEPFKKGLDSFATDYAKNPNALRHRGQALAETTALQAGKGLAYLSNSLSQTTSDWVKSGVKSLSGSLNAGKQSNE